MTTGFRESAGASVADIKRFVCLVEDEPATTLAIVEELERRGVDVAVKGVVSDAEVLVREHRCDLILIDLRIAQGRHDLHRGGERFAIDMSNGVFGPTNATTPFVILTAFPYEADREGLGALQNYCGVIDKTASSLATLAASTANLCPWLTELTFDEPDLPHIMVDLLMVEEQSVDDSVHFTVPSWSSTEKVPVKTDRLPAELQQELAYGYRPVFVWAKVNVRASRAEYVRPHDYAIHEVDDDNSTFDWMKA
ncbi:MAG: hypothetical protein JWP83_4963 [Mycobacterium sp.]|jgi:hypothetical protein|uniref:hypothetical protein n=1 Tax=Mycobacterium sp. TaxID=1785 RepID=UPI002622FF40|nr:hypothetical protein [Mycobacterium sp.]MCW2663811.1 hypothetical protein [Mycobacterium sp.]